MTNRGLGRRCVIAAAVLILSVSACGENAAGPPESQANQPPGSEDPRRTPVGPNATTPPGSGQITTLPSNQPPDSGLRDGWNLVSAATERYTNDFDALLHDYGQDVGVAFAAGTPVVAWASLTDSANNGYTISTSALSPGGSWTPPVEMVRARMAPSPNGRLFSISGGRPDGVVALAHERRDDNGLSVGVDVMFTTDAGATWVRSSAVEGEAFHPTVIVAPDAVHVAFVGADGYAVSSTPLPPVVLTDPPTPIDARALTWKVQSLPGLEGYGPMDVAPAAALDPTGSPSFAVLVASITGKRRAAIYSTLTARSATKAVEVSDVTPGTASVSLAFRGADPLVAVSFEPRPNDDALAYLSTSSDGGATFGSPALVPRELHENAPFGVSMAVLGGTGAGRTRPVADGSGTTTSVGTPGSTLVPVPVGRTVLVYEPDAIDVSSSRCGLPRLVTSQDLSTWSTCGAGTDTVTPATAVQPANLAPVAVAGPDGRLYVAVTNRNPSARVPLGVALWRGA